MRDVITVAGALADEGRVRVVLALRRAGELCVCQVTELLGLATSTVSKHMAILKAAGLVTDRKEGRWVYYRLAGDEAPEAVRRAVEWVACAARGDERAKDDERRVKEILCEGVEAICRRQAAGRNGSKCCSSAPATRAGARWPRGGRRRSRAT